jgi:hypothetical protein
MVLSNMGACEPGFERPRVPPRKTPRAAARAPKGAERSVGIRQVESILSRRQQLVAEVVKLREQHSNSKFIENAQQLLTRWWSPADWNAREDLLKTVDWLLRNEKRRNVCLPASMQLHDPR